jgi:hypothetical protein
MLLSLSTSAFTFFFSFTSSAEEQLALLQAVLQRQAIEQQEAVKEDLRSSSSSVSSTSSSSAQSSLLGGIKVHPRLREAGKSLAENTKAAASSLSTELNRLKTQYQLEEKARMTVSAAQSALEPIVQSELVQRSKENVKAVG